MRAGIRRLLVVLAVAGAGFVPAPADAAYCSGSGVNVVVDHGALGGGIVKDCDGSGNRNAAEAFERTGHHLSYATRQPGFVCRVGGVPASDPCVNTSPADAYWGLYWSDGTSGWKYSSLAAGSLTVPAGATVAFSWQNGGTADPPGTAPATPPSAAQPSSPSSSPKPTTAPTKPRPTATRAPTGSASLSSGSATPSTTGSASATGSAEPSASATPSASASVTPSASESTAVASGTTSARLDDSSASGGGLPWWVPIGSILALAGAGGVVWQVRRARS